MMLRISLVSYLNTQPFIQGLMDEFSDAEIEINPVIPSQCALDLKEGHCDFALIPTGSILEFPQLEIEKDFCIGANGAVDSVFLFANKPIGKLEKVILDPHSRTSNGLLQVLMANYWSKKMLYLKPEKRDFSLIKGKTGAVVIGDAAYKIRDQFKYVYDLSEEWKNWTGLPFVFAVWASLPGTISPKMRKRLISSFKKGWENRKATGIAKGKEFGYEPEAGGAYLFESIKYLFDWPKHKAFHKYLALLAELATKDKKSLIQESLG